MLVHKPIQPNTRDKLTEKSQTGMGGYDRIASW